MSTSLVLAKLSLLPSPFTSSEMLLDMIKIDELAVLYMPLRKEKEKRSMYLNDLIDFNANLKLCNKKFNVFFITAAYIETSLQNLK